MPDDAAPGGVSSTRLLRYSAWDALLIALAIAHGAALIAMPSIPLVALGLWWNSNTISHNFIHLPFFRSRVANGLFSAYLSLLLGLPQTLWRARHLAHHAGAKWRLRPNRELVVETGLVLSLWSALIVIAPRFVATVYLPGFILGLILCWLQGHYEHARGTTSHYSALYNWLFFNDGYHVEHHTRPATHWKRLPTARKPRAVVSRWPAVLRWFETFTLDSLERVVLRSIALQRFVLRTHTDAFERLLRHLGPIRSVTIVGGGIFPRTALILQRLLPAASLQVIDANAANLRQAEKFLTGSVALKHEFFDPMLFGRPEDCCDLLVLPLSFKGERAAVYAAPPARAVLVQDWIWKVRGSGTVVSLLLLKRVNLVVKMPTDVATDQQTAHPEFASEPLQVA